MTAAQNTSYVEVMYQAESDETQPGLTLGQIRRHYKHPLGIPAHAIAEVDGRRACDEDVVEAGMTVQFFVQRGRKECPWFREDELRRSGVKLEQIDEFCRDHQYSDDWETTDSGHRIVRDTLFLGHICGQPYPPPNEPLTELQQEVFELIQNEGPIMGTAITRRLDIAQSTLTSHIIPVLKRLRNVRNKYGAGYYVADNGNI